MVKEVYIFEKQFEELVNKWADKLDCNKDSKEEMDKLRNTLEDQMIRRGEFIIRDADLDFCASHDEKK